MTKLQLKSYFTFSLEAVPTPDDFHPFSIAAASLLHFDVVFLNFLKKTCESMQSNSHASVWKKNKNNVAYVDLFPFI